MKTELLSLTPREFCRITKACEEGAKFAAQYASMREVWGNCRRVDWLVWILNAIDAPKDERACRLFMVWCARNTPIADGRTTGSLLTDHCSIAALDVAERHAKGMATDEQLAAAWAAAGAAGAAAWDAAWDAAWAAAWDAAWAAAWDAQTAQFKAMIANPFAATGGSK